jgi:hypothetical protein
VGEGGVPVARSRVPGGCRRARCCRRSPAGVGAAPVRPGLFGFDYRIEIYVPAQSGCTATTCCRSCTTRRSERAGGLKSDRKAGVLRVLASWLERGSDAAGTAEALAAELRRAAPCNVRLDEVVVEPAAISRVPDAGPGLSREPPVRDALVSQVVVVMVPLSAQPRAGARSSCCPREAPASGARPAEPCATRSGSRCAGCCSVAASPRVSAFPRGEWTLTGVDRVTNPRGAPSPPPESSGRRWRACTTWRSSRWTSATSRGFRARGRGGAGGTTFERARDDVIRLTARAAAAEPQPTTRTERALAVCAAQGGRRGAN